MTYGFQIQLVRKKSNQALVQLAMNFNTHCNLIYPMYLLSARKIDKTISKLMYIQCERQKHLASYTNLMEDTLHFMFSNGKTFFFALVGDKQLGLRSLSSLQIQAQMQIYCCGNTVIPLSLASQPSNDFLITSI